MSSRDEITRRLRAGERPRQIARELGVSPAWVYHVRSSPRCGQPGRPKKNPDVAAKVPELLRLGMTVRAMAAKLGVSQRTVGYAIERMKLKGGK